MCRVISFVACIALAQGLLASLRAVDGQYEIHIHIYGYSPFPVEPPQELRYY